MGQIGGSHHQYPLIGPIIRNEKNNEMYIENISHVGVMYLCTLNFNDVKTYEYNTPFSDYEIKIEVDCISSKESFIVPLIVETKVSGTVVVIAEIVEINHLKAIQLINKSLIISVKDFLKEFYGPEILKDFKRTRYIPPAIRYKVMERDGKRCRTCGRSSSSPGVELEVDHIIPFAKGGNNDLDNLQTLCKDCNRGKGSRRF
jgi:hypothetical protein